MRRLYVELDEDTARALRHRAVGERRSLRDQASLELERALADAYRSEAPPSDVTHEHKKGTPDNPWRASGAPRKGT